MAFLGSSSPDIAWPLLAVAAALFAAATSSFSGNGPSSFAPGFQTMEEAVGCSRGKTRGRFPFSERFHKTFTGCFIPPARSHEGY